MDAERHEQDNGGEGETRSEPASHPSVFGIADLVDAPMLQSMMHDFYALTGIPMSLIDLDGVVIVGVGWQEVCTGFHRVNPETCAFCIESDTVLTADIPDGEIELYRCKNGMWDAATPIVVDGERVANLFTGQFFFTDEPVDVQFFREQAQRYGFDERSYLEAVEAVPRLTRQTVETGLKFLTKLSNMISSLTLTNLQRQRAEERLQTALESQTALNEDVARERGVLRAIMENTDTHLAYLDPDFRFVEVNTTYARGSGHAREELIGRDHFDVFPDEENEAVFRRARETGEPVEFRAKPFVFADQPWRGITYWDWRLTPIREPRGRLRGFAFSLVDVTQVVRTRRFSEALNRLNDVIHSTLQFDAILSQVVPELAGAIGCEAVGVALTDDSATWRMMEVFGLPAWLKERPFSTQSLPGSAQALATGQPVVLSEADGSLNRELAEQVGVRSMLVAPLSAPSRVAGVVAFAYVTGPGSFDEEQADFAGKVAASLSLALENARLYETEHRIADQLQKALLALPDQIPGIEFAQAYNSAAEAALVGGDFYDVFELDPERVGIVIGDVAGKGLDAAVLTSMVKNTIRAHASERGKTPSRVLGLTNDVLFRTTPSESFVTVFFGVLDRADGRLSYANAGHTTAAVLSSNGSVARLPVTGPLLGGFEEVAFGQDETLLAEDALLFLYTDGLTEARGPGGGFYSEERLFGVLAAARERAAAPLVEAVLGDVLGFTDGRLSDDLAVLAVRRQRREDRSRA